MNTIYGDGSHDDAPGIQDLLDTRQSIVYLPAPAQFYSISKPLRIHSYQQLRLDRFTRIRLMDGSDCVMLENVDQTDGSRDIAVCGGIWDMNNMGQSKNPLHFPAASGKKYPDDNDIYSGFCMRFRRVKGLTVREMTFQDPVTFCLWIGETESFTVEDLVFDFNYGNPWAVNMDGVHLCSGCRMGVIRNLKGSCYDDMVALNADEGYPGAIENIQIDGLFADDCHSAVRLLSTGSPVRNISIANVYGTFYQYCIGITKYFHLGDAFRKGNYDNLSFRNIYAAKAPRLSVYRKDGTFVYPLIWAEADVNIGSLSIENLHRCETATAISTLTIERGTNVDRLSVQIATHRNMLPNAISFLHNKGNIAYLSLTDIETYGDQLIENEGTIANL
ncbi:hypothetical protein AGMMS49992_10800 [Clostridia bacterium]|nr:hypothetical protein AGMMS49992_10800 [Clostridia bacterium]